MLQRRLLPTIALVAVTVTALAACGGTKGGGTGSSGSGGGSGQTLVVDDQFDLKTADPGRAFEITGADVTHNTYETTLTFKGADVKNIVPGICTYTISKDNKVVTLKMTGTHTFSDGSPVTADDIVFSYQRVQGIAGNPSFLLDGVTVKKVDANTITLTSKEANPQLPYILPNPSLGILNSKVVKANGGTTTSKDAAEQFLDKNSQGSGPYMIDSYDVQNKVVFKLNPHYAGTKPAYSRVVLENVAAASQKVNLQAGRTNIALSLTPDQLTGLDTSKTQVVKGQSSTTIFMWFNQNATYGKQASNAKFIQAVRHAIDYSAVVKLAGSGAVQPGGLVPISFLGSLKTDSNNTYNPTLAKSLLAQSGYKGQPIKMLYSNDVGYGLDDQAQAIQAQVKKIGINFTLNPQPSSTSLDAFRSGTSQGGIAYWGADYPDPADYLVFAPGESLGKRAAWTVSDDATANTLAQKASTAVGATARAAAYQALQKQFNATGPWIPLYQPADLIAGASNIKGISDNAVWGLDWASLTT